MVGLASSWHDLMLGTSAVPLQCSPMDMDCWQVANNVWDKLVEEVYWK